MFQLTTVHEVQAEGDLSGTTTNGIATGTACAERWTCTSCTEGTTPSCSWSVAEQTCADSVAATELRSRLVVTDRSSCPKFSVENIFSAMADNKVTITVTVDDGHEGRGFVDLLDKSSVTCQLYNKTIKANVDGDRISCTLTYTKSRYNVKCRDFVPVVSHLLILFDDDKFLRFDNASDHYMIGYPSDCPDIECLDCNRNNGTHRTYCTRCSNNNTTSVNTKPFHYCEVRKTSNFVKSNSDKTKIGDMCGDSAGPAVMLRSDQPEPEVPAGNYNSFPIVSTVPTVPTVPIVPIVPTVPIVPMVPTVDDGQTFGGIASGGTMFVVKGRSFSGLQNAKACFNDKTTCVHCSIINDTSMECRSPKFVVNETQTVIETKSLKFYGKDPAGNVLKLNLDPFEYRLYQDPVFTDYMVNGCCNLTVNGLYLDQGYATGDLSILLDAENSSSVCGPITWMDSTQIVCQSSQLDPLPKQINVKVGNYISIVKLTKQKSSRFKNSLAAIILPGVVTIGAYVSFIAVLCVALIFFKSSKDYDLLHLHGPQQLAEMRPLDEKNFNDYDNNSESNNMLSKYDE